MSSRKSSTEFHFEDTGVADSDSEKWEFVHSEIMDEDEGQRGDPIPSIKFPGTWEAARDDAAKVAHKVSVATYSYAGAIAHSGIPDLGRSTGTAMARTANRTAQSAAQYALNASGISQRKLPGIFQDWLKSKQELDKTKRRAAEARKARELRKLREQLSTSYEVLADSSASRHDRADFELASDRDVCLVRSSDMSELDQIAPEHMMCTDEYVEETDTSMDAPNIDNEDNFDPAYHNLHFASASPNHNNGNPRNVPRGSIDIATRDELQSANTWAELSRPLDMHSPTNDVPARPRKYSRGTSTDQSPYSNMTLSGGCLPLMKVTQQKGDEAEGFPRE